MRTSDLVDLLGKQRPGWSLEQPFYCDPAIFQLELDHLLAPQWFIVAHASELPADGTVLVRELLGQSILVVRDGDEIRAFYNVCTHRGSRLCREDTRARVVVCPYHAWGFRLNGELQTKRDIPDGIDPRELGLRSVATTVIGGVVLCSLGGERAHDPSAAAAALIPAMHRHGFENARIVARKSYPTNANWKLVMENFFECYHCRPSHPEYFRVNGHVKVTAVRDPSGAAEWNEGLEAWRAARNDPDFNTPRKDPGAVGRMAYSLYRQPIGNGRVTLSREGTPVSKLMGSFTEYDGGETGFHFGRFSFASATNDYIALVQIIPRAVEETEVIFTWLVDKDAPADIDAEAISWMWDVTTVQDKQIVEENAFGVRSRGYRPGPYTPLESQTSSFVSTYCDEMRSLLASPSPVQKLARAS